MRMSLMTYIFRMHLTEAYTLRQRDISVKEGLSTVQFYVCTAIVMLLLLSTITCAGNMKRGGRSLAREP